MVFDQIKELVAEQFGVEIDSITEDTSFKEDLGADSLDIVELIMAIEEKLGVEIQDENLEDIATLGDVADYINKKAQ